MLAIETSPRLARRTPGGGASAQLIARAIAPVIACLLALAPSFARAAVETGVSLEVLARTAGSDGAGAFPVRDGGVLRSGDGIQLHLRARADAYVYVIAYGSSHSAALVFPYSGRPEDALVRAGSERIVPRHDLYLPLDDVQGRESLFTIVADAPVEDIAGLMARMETQRDDLLAVAEVVRAAHPQSTRLTFKHLGKAPLVGVDLAAVPRAGATPQTGSAQAGLDLGARRFASETATPSQDSAAVVGPDLATLPRPGQTDSAARWATPAATTRAPAAAESASPGGEAAESNALATARDGELPAAPEPAASTGTQPAAGKEQASAALVQAREAAGIDAAEFSAILSTLPPGPTGDRPAGREVGVLSAVGERIRALERRDPRIERRFEQLERQVPDRPDLDPQAPADDGAGRRSFGGGNEQVSIGDPVLPTVPQ